MRRILVALACALTVLASGTPASAAHPSAPVRLIVDTDFGQWWDDVAALAVAHTAARQGSVRILGEMSDVDNPYDAAALDALNTWYGRPGIPIGVPTGAVAAGQNYSQLIAERYPHHGTPTDALDLYRRLLRAQPDHSVTILSIGALTNLARLVRTDRALVARKVARTVIMGGQYPSAPQPEWNFNLDAAATRTVLASWPAPVVFDGFEVGARVFVGDHVCASHPVDSPVRLAFDVLYGCGNDQTDGTWDPTAMYDAIFGDGGVFARTGQGGHNTLDADGRNAWVPGGSGQSYLLLTDPDRLTRTLDALLDAVPPGRR